MKKKLTDWTLPFSLGHQPGCPEDLGEWGRKQSQTREPGLVCESLASLSL